MTGERLSLLLREGGVAVGAGEGEGEGEGERPARCWLLLLWTSDVVGAGVGGPCALREAGVEKPESRLGRCDGEGRAQRRGGVADIAVAAAAAFGRA